MYLTTEMCHLLLALLNVGDDALQPVCDVPAQAGVALLLGGLQLQPGPARLASLWASLAWISLHLG